MEVVFPRFRDTQDLHIRLRDYYDDPTVLRYLKRLEGGGGSPLAAAAAIVKIGTEATAAHGNMKSSVFPALRKVFPLGSTNGIVNTEEQYDVYDSAYEMQTQEAAEKDDQYISGAMALEVSIDLNPEDSSVQDLKYQIKDLGMKLMCAGVAVGLLTLAGLKYLPGRSIFPITKKGMSAEMAADVSTKDENLV